MRGRSIALVGCSVAALAGTVAASGDSDSGGSGSSGGTLNLYSSLPLQGASRPQSEDVVKGIKLALKQHNNKAGGKTIKYTSLDDSTAAAGQWDAAQTKSNAPKVAQDDKAIAYIGEFNSGASVNSIPTTNEAGILQVSPSNTLFGLTKGGVGAEDGEPDKYYPAGKRTYGRVVPIDNIQGAAMAQYMKDEGVTSAYILNDQQVYGKGIASFTSKAAKADGIAIAGSDSWDGKASNYRALAAKIKASGADGVLIGGIIDNNAIQLAKDIYAAAPDIKQFGPDGVATVDYVKGLSPAIQKQTFLTVATVDAKDLPASGQKFYSDYKKEYPGDDIDPYAIYGYESAAIVLDSIDKAKGDRQGTIDAFFATKDRQSVFGTYSIDKDGDTTLTTYGAYTAKGGKLVFNKAIKAATS